MTFSYCPIFEPIQVKISTFVDTCDKKSGVNSIFRIHFLLKLTKIFFQTLSSYFCYKIFKLDNVNVDRNAPNKTLEILK